MASFNSPVAHEDEVGICTVDVLALNIVVLDVPEELRIGNFGLESHRILMNIRAGLELKLHYFTGASSF